MLSRILLTALLASTALSASSKRGLIYISGSKHPSDDNIWIANGSDLTWYYNYGYYPTPAYASHSSLGFVPMLWGASDNDQGTPFLDAVTSMVKSGANVSHVLAFNEPDGTSATGGSNVPADLAAKTWVKQIEPLKKLGVQLGAPAVTGSPGGFTWLESFFKACNSSDLGGCHPDFIPVHWYGNFEGMASHIGEVMATYPGLKVWVTEFAYPNQDKSDTQSFFNSSLEYFDRMENITRYSYFGAFRSDVSNVGSNTAMLSSSGKLNDLGQLYLGGVDPKSIHSGAGSARAGDVSAAVAMTLAATFFSLF